jgi:radical SAM family RiPP maturation amino acid epimerase
MTLKPSAGTLAYQSIFERRTADDMHTLAHIKRFMELLVGDAAFRVKLRDSLGNLKALADEHRLDFDLDAALPLFHVKYMHHRYQESEAQWPMAKAWDDYMKEMIIHRDLIRDSGGCEEVNPRFHAWRERQMLRTDSQLGSAGSSIVHPIAAFELADGCSVGCWFCGISADRFKGYWAYDDESSALWNGVVHEMVELFGTAAQTGFCYWGTDPSDNPDYPRYLRDYYKHTGMLPQTTTAAPLKNVALTREIIGLFDEYRCVTNRFSILTTKYMHQVHAEFTPDELMGVELVLQGKEALTVKANAGRVMERRDALREAGKAEKADELTKNEQGTIACVTGLLVNMVHKTVKLVTPTPASKRWPLGYRIYEEAKFRSAAEFRDVVESIIDAHMPEDLVGDDVIEFRDDLKYTQHEDGFVLEAYGQTHSMRGGEHFAMLGKVVSQGGRTAGEIHRALVDAGADLFVTAETMRRLFDTGLLNDDPKLNGLRPRKKPEAAEAAAAVA